MRLGYILNNWCGSGREQRKMLKDFANAAVAICGNNRKIEILEKQLEVIYGSGNRNDRHEDWHTIYGYPG